MATSENALLDEVIKRRLLIDGDGVGDDRRITNLMKSIIGFCTSEESPDESEMSFRKMLGKLKETEFSARRTHQCIRVSELTKLAYDEFGLRVKQEIEATKDQITESKVVLEQATKLRKCSMEYDALAKLIKSKPDRKETEKRCVKLSQKYENLNAQKQKLDDRLAQHKRNILFMTSEIHVLRDLVKDDDLTQDIHTSLSDEDITTDEITPASPLKPSLAVGSERASNGVKSGGSEESGASSPMDLDRAMIADQVPLESNNEGELSQAASPANIRGTVTSAPLSPVDKAVGLENCEDLSEEENVVDGS